MRNWLFLLVSLLLYTARIWAQGSSTRVPGTEEYGRVTIVTIDEQGAQVERVFTASPLALSPAVDSAVYRQYAAYMAQLKREGYSLKSTASGHNFIEETYTKRKQRRKRWTKAAQQ
jgi:hypothetical protein